MALGTNRDYVERDPSAANLVLVCEVSNSTYQYDRTTKYKLYASAGVPEYWIVDLKNRRLLVITEPNEAGDYAPEQSFDAATDFTHERFGSKTAGSLSGGLSPARTVVAALTRPVLAKALEFDLPLIWIIICSERTVGDISLRSDRHHPALRFYRKFFDLAE